MEEKLNHIYREAQCPYCNNKFMWAQVIGDNRVHYKEKDKEGINGEYLYETICGHCKKKFLIRSGSTPGYDFDDKRVEKLPEPKVIETDIVGDCSYVEIGGKAFFVDEPLDRDKTEELFEAWMTAKPKG